MAWSRIGAGIGAVVISVVLVLLIFFMIGKRAEPPKGPQSPATVMDQSPPIEAVHQQVVQSMLVDTQPHFWFAQLVKTVQNESLPECVNNLGNIDDSHLADTSVEEEISYFAGSFQVQSIPRLVRVRRLLASNKDEAVAQLRRSLRDAMAKADGARDEMERQMAARGGTYAGPRPEWSKLQVNAGAAVYLLVEFRDYQSLSLLRDLCDFVNQSPEKVDTLVPRDMLIYGMLRLITNMPRDGLPVGQLQFLDSCTAAQKTLREPTILMTTSWDDSRPEHDPRSAIMGEDLNLQPRLMFRTPEWNLRFTDNERMAVNNLLRSRSKEVYATLRKFVNSLPNVDFQASIPEVRH